MNSAEFRRHGHQVVDWIATYLEEAEKYPVMSRNQPGDTLRLLPEEPPAEGESMQRILEDFERDILPGVTHWNHPRFFAYFPANNSGPSILGEMLSAGLGVNAMSWQTSPAATELEQRVMDWLKILLDLPTAWHGVIQDTASTATLVALLCAREKATDFAANTAGPAAMATGGALRIYTSTEAHSSVTKGAKIAGFGSENVVRVPTDKDHAMDPEALAAHIAADLDGGLRPCCVVATVGTTGSTAIDPVPAISEIAERHGLWLHVDAALAGSAAILPQMRWILAGCERADSFVFNPHKWLFTNFDCSAFYVRDAAHLEQTLTINPEYLRTDRDQEVHNYRDWGIQLGRRFRALKLWFVLRSYGVAGLREKVAEHLALAQKFAAWVDENPRWERLAPVPLNTICFRWRPEGVDDEEQLDTRNKDLMDRVNARGEIFLTHTKLAGKFTLRLAVGQTTTRMEHVEQAWRALNEVAVV